MPGPAARVHASRSPFAAALRTWRTARKLSQEELAARAGVSTRHLSFVENGRSRPSRELTSALGQALDLPLRERNQLLLAAGFAPGYERTPLGSEALRGLRRALDHVLAQQEPYGAVVVDRAWNVLEMNAGARRVFTRFPPRSADGLAALGNLITASLHPEALRPYLVNWLEVAAALMARLQHEVATLPADDERHRLLAQVLAMPDVPTSWRDAAPGATDPFLTVHLRGPDLEVRLFSMLTSIGTPRDVTVDELHVETYFPADDASERVLRALAGATP